METGLAVCLGFAAGLRTNSLPAELPAAAFAVSLDFAAAFGAVTGLAVPGAPAVLPLEAAAPEELEAETALSESPEAAVGSFRAFAEAPAGLTGRGARGCDVSDTLGASPF